MWCDFNFYLIKSLIWKNNSKNNTAYKWEIKLRIFNESNKILVKWMKEDGQKC